MKTAVEIMREVLAVIDGVTELHRYSGRAMYGRDCFAVSGSFGSCQRFVAEAIKFDSQEVFDDACNCGESDQAQQQRDLHLSQHHQNIDAMLNYSWDAFGRDVVFYWTEIEYTEPTEQHPMVVLEIVKPDGDVGYFRCAVTSARKFIEDAQVNVEEAWDYLVDNCWYSADSGSKTSMLFVSVDRPEAGKVIFFDTSYPTVAYRTAIQSLG